MVLPSPYQTSVSCNACNACNAFGSVRNSFIAPTNTAAFALICGNCEESSVTDLEEKVKIIESKFNIKVIGPFEPWENWEIYHGDISW